MSLLAIVVSLGTDTSLFSELIVVVVEVSQNTSFASQTKTSLTSQVEFVRQRYAKLFCASAGQLERQRHEHENDSKELKRLLCWLLLWTTATAWGFDVRSAASTTTRHNHNKCCSSSSLATRHHHNQPLPPQWRPSTHDNNNPPSTSSSQRRLVATQLRGGATTAYACAAFLGVNGLLVALLPDAIMKDLYKIERPNNQASKALSKNLLQFIGSVAIGVSLLVGLTTEILPIRNTAWMTLPRAIGISFVPRLGVMTYLWATRYRTRVLLVNVLLMALATGGMLIGNKVTPAKVFPAMSIVKALLLRWKPQAMAKKVFEHPEDIDSEEMKQSKALLRGLSNEILTSSLFQLLLMVGGMKAFPAAGWTCALWVVLLADMGFVDKTWKLMDASGPIVQVIHMIISALFATGFFLNF